MGVYRLAWMIAGATFAGILIGMVMLPRHIFLHLTGGAAIIGGIALAVTGSWKGLILVPVGAGFILVAIKHHATTDQDEAAAAREAAARTRRSQIPFIDGEDL